MMASFTEFIVNGHYFTSPNQHNPPPNASNDATDLGSSFNPTELRRVMWAVDDRPYLPFILTSPFHGVITRRFATPPDRMDLVNDEMGYYLPTKTAKTWKTLEKCLCRTATTLRFLFAKDHPNTKFISLTPTDPSEFGYYNAHASEKKARFALSQSVDAFVILFAYVSFSIALCKSPNDPASFSPSSPSKPRWFNILSGKESGLHPEWLNLLAESPLVHFTSAQQRVGVIVNVARCSWLSIVPYMLKVHVPIWLYWGVPPAFVQPLDTKALCFAPRSHPQSSNLAPAASNPARPIVPSAAIALSAPIALADAGQLPGETCSEFLTRQNQRRQARLQQETDSQRRARENCERSAAKKNRPAKKGPLVYVWEYVNGGRIRTLLARGHVEEAWRRYDPPEKIFNYFDNCWDCCSEFDDDTPGEVEMDSDSDNNSDIFPHRKRQLSTPAVSSKVGSSGDAVRPAMPELNPSRELESPGDAVRPTTPVLNHSRELESPSRSPIPTHVQDYSRSTDPQGESIPMDEEDDDYNLLDASRQDVLNAYSFVAYDLEQMPINTLDELVYYRYGFSLNETAYSGIPASVKDTSRKTFRSWVEVCRSVGGNGLEIGKKNWAPIQDFLSILAGSVDPFKDVPGKYWDLSALGLDPLMSYSPIFISIEDKMFNNGTQYLIHPLGLHPSRDTSWHLSVDPMTALECIRRGLGPHTLDIANFLIDYGVHFRTIQRISNPIKEPSVRPKCRFLGNRSTGYKFDLADFAGYEALRDAFLRSQPHGPVALRQGGIIARLAREVLPNSVALSGPSADALSGHRARFVFEGGIYVDDEFSTDELQLICGTYEVGKIGKGVQPKRVSWFPPANIWNDSGYNVGQWTDDCEKWFRKHMSAIRSGAFQPLSSADWRTQILGTRIAKKLTFQMKKAAAAYLSAQ